MGIFKALFLFLKEWCYGEDGLVVVVMVMLKREREREVCADERENDIFIKYNFRN